MIVVTILIPLADNVARTFSAEHHRAFELALAEFFGGFTKLPGEALGAWLDKGRLYNDTTRAYQVAVTGLLERASAIMDAVQLARMHYRQESIFVTYLGAAEIIGA